jgi:rsbT co-antagonist protein RsbR
MSYDAASPVEDEIVALRRQIDDLERMLLMHQHMASDLRASEESRRRAENRFRRLIEAAPDGMLITDQNGVILLVNQQLEELFGYNRAELIGQSVDILLPERLRGDHIHQRVRYMADPHTRPMGFGLDLLGQRKNGEEFSVEISLSPLESDDGMQVICSIRDSTARKQAEAERSRLQEEIIRVQEATLRELSTPLIPISDQVVVMPLVGTVDSRRAQQIVETLLEGVAGRGAQTALIDITGVVVVDTQVANILIQAAQAVRLLGARVVLTGIRPEIAQTLVGLGVSLGAMETRSDLQSGIAYAVRQSQNAQSDRV